MARVRSICFVALFALAACSGAKPTATTPSPSPSASKTGVKGEASGNPLPGATAAAFASPKATATPTSELGACPGRTAYTTQSGEPGGNYIRASTTLTRKWGPKCESLDVGDRCSVGWNASYNVLEGNDAYIEFQAWAKGAKAPFKKHMIGPLAPQNSFHDVGFPVTIPRASEVAFRLVLLNSGKVAVAISDASVYPVGCRQNRG